MRKIFLHGFVCLGVFFAMFLLVCQAAYKVSSSLKNTTESASHALFLTTLSLFFIAETKKEGM